MDCQLPQFTKFAEYLIRFENDRCNINDFVKDNRAGVFATFGEFYIELVRQTASYVVCLLRHI